MIFKAHDRFHVTSATKQDCIIFDLADKSNQSLGGVFLTTLLLTNDSEVPVKLSFDGADTVDGSYAQSHADVVISAKGKVVVELGSAKKFQKISGFVGK